ncbi:MAG TPA: MBOAT family O-acyltransferase [Candidatus Nitrosotalea sp.]|nr:MBOAT family O-acyltransferase [Candidatus Nitrosotalea sp.]
MLFTTIDFVVFFIVILATIVIIKNRKFQYLFLLFASYFFFYYSSNYLLVLLIFTTVWDFFFGKVIYSTQEPKRRKIYLIISLCGNLGLLGFFKYSDFAIFQFNMLGNYLDLSQKIPLLSLALPIGISFYTFHSLTYTVGIYRGQLSPAKSFLEYALFVSFFPQLIAGPILRAKEFLPQMRQRLDGSEIGTRLRQIVLEKQNLRVGITLMGIGFFKKMVFADNISPLVNQIFSHPMILHSFTVILGAIGFGIQIYSDFSGYSDIAIGAATILGFKIPNNFNNPYFASSPSNFWKRWHISLSTWLRDYLYIPLGGNRKSRKRTYCNLIVVMFLGGLWHGASLNFVIWGLLHGVYITIQKMAQDRFPRLKDHPIIRSKVGRILSIIATQYLVFFTWLAFRIQDTNGLVFCMKKYVFLDFKVLATQDIILSHKFAVSLIVIFLIANVVSYKKPHLLEKITNLKARYWIGFLTIIIFTVYFTYGNNPQDFIYFRF